MTKELKETAGEFKLNNIGEKRVVLGAKILIAHSQLPLFQAIMTKVW